MDAREPARRGFLSRALPAAALASGCAMLAGAVGGLAAVDRELGTRAPESRVSTTPPPVCAPAPSVLRWMEGDGRCGEGRTDREGSR